MNIIIAGAGEVGRHTAEVFVPDGHNVVVIDQSAGDIDDVGQFAERYAALQSRDDYEHFVSIYGMRRTNSAFWETADWFQDEYLREKPIGAGLFDLNRYQNR